MSSHTMRRLLAPLLLALLVLTSAAMAQGRETLGMATFTPPSGWTREANPGGISYSRVDRTSGAWCIVSVVATEGSRGSLTADFEAAWVRLFADKNQAEGAVEKSDEPGPNGSESRTGVARFTFNGAPAVASVTTFRLGQQACSVLVLTNNPAAFEKALGTFEHSLVLSPQSGNTTAGRSPSAPPAAASGGRRDIVPTTFDDGWTSVAEADWVRTTKGNLTVLIHYPTAEDSVYYSSSHDETEHFWNKLVAPRYANLRSFTIGYNTGFESARFAFGTVLDPRTGQDVYLVLFKKKGTDWMELICPSKAAFVAAFKVDLDTVDKFETEWQSLTRMGTYNRFGVAAADLRGTWTNNFSGLTQYVNAQTGLSAGTDTHTSRETFTFGAGSTYRWDLGVADGFVGNIRFQNVHSVGTFQVPSCWKVSFSDIERKPRTYNAYFSAVRNGKLLWLDGTAYGLKK